MTKIEWTDATWNPVRGCSMAKGSGAGGCLNCYAARMAARNMPGHRSPTTGEPFAVVRGSGPRWTGKVELIPGKLAEPLHWRKPRRCFVNSMSDLFHESLPFEAIAAVFGVMAVCPHITFQVLTKRPERAAEYFGRGEEELMSAWAFMACNALTSITGDPVAASAVVERAEPRFPLPNVHLGISAENQETADVRIPRLLEIPAAVRFLSYEPALGPVDFSRWLGRKMGISWLIAGGESGPGARPPHPDWFRSVRDQCVAAGVPFFFKQWGEWTPDRSIANPVKLTKSRWSHKSAALFPDGTHYNARFGHPDHRPGEPFEMLWRVGKRKAGRLLDGRTWDEFPAL